MKDVTPSLAGSQLPKLLDQLRRCIRDNHYSLRTERAYVYWARWYICIHGVHHPMDMGGLEHAEVSTTMIYVHVLNRGGRG